MGRKFLFFTISIFFKLFTRVEKKGLENIPKEGGAIIAINHPGRAEIFLAFTMTQRKDVTGLVAEKYEDIWITRMLIHWIDGIFLDRFNPDIHALRSALDYLKRGWILGVAPEGTRSPTPAMQEAKPGIAYLAAKSGVPVVPAGAVVPRESLRQILKFKKPPIQIHFGAPFFLPPLTGKDKDAQLKAGTDEIMCQIAALLPEDMHGYYADHPRLKELLAPQK